MEEAKIKGIEINWMLAWDNDPSIRVWVEEIPRDIILTPHRVNPTRVLWYGTKAGIARFYADTTLENSLESKQEDGFGGSHFHIMTPQGEHVLKGPWSSRPGVMNALHPDAIYNPCVDISLTDSESTFDRGYTYMASNMTAEVLAPALQEVFGLTLYQAVFYDELVFTLDKNDCGLASEEWKSKRIIDNSHKWSKKI